MIRWKDREIEPDNFEERSMPRSLFRHCQDQESPEYLREMQSIEFRNVVFNYPTRPDKKVLRKPLGQGRAWHAAVKGFNGELSDPSTRYPLPARAG